MEELQRGDSLAGTTRPTIKQVSGSGESVRPKPWWHGGVEEKSAHAFGERPDDSLGAAILGRSIRTRQLKVDAVRGEKSAESFVIKLFAIVSTESTNRSLELSSNIGMEGNEELIYIRFLA